LLGSSHVRENGNSNGTRISAGAELPKKISLMLARKWSDKAKALKRKAFKKGLWP